jgi:hypothetical protein
VLYLHTAEWVLDRSPYTGEPKTNTRRLEKPGDFAVYDESGQITAVRDRNGKLRWRVGGEYEVQPRYAARGLGRTLLLAIRHEDAWRISHEDARAEGFRDVHHFAEVFVLINGKRAIQRRVWVLVFRLSSRVVRV